jgi:hypothetical protein
VNDLPPAEILRRVRPIPTYRDHPATSPADIEGVTPAGEPLKIHIVDSKDPVLLVFLSSSCLGCMDLWEGTAALRQSLPAALRIILVTRGPDHEDVEAITALCPADTTTVMSTQAFRDYGVSGPPFLAVVCDGSVQTEGVAWGLAETVRAARAVLGESP